MSSSLFEIHFAILPENKFYLISKHNTMEEAEIKLQDIINNKINKEKYTIVFEDSLLGRKIRNESHEIIYKIKNLHDR